MFFPGWGPVLGYEEEGQRYEAGVLRGKGGTSVGHWLALLPRGGATLF